MQYEMDQCAKNRPLAGQQRGNVFSTVQKSGDYCRSAMSNVGVTDLSAGDVAAGLCVAEGTAARISKQSGVGFVMLIYFVSGACSLMDEVVWVRLLKLTLGNTVYASTIVVSTFMGGLALGALIMSRHSDRITRRLQLYALLEALITVSALSLPRWLKLADAGYVWFYRTYHPSHAQLLIIQIIISAGILLVPSMLMGSTLPLLGRFVTALEKEAGRLVGKLYALNTLGATAGCFLAGFVLIRAFGVMGTLYTAALLNLMVASSALLLSYFCAMPSKGQAEEAVVADKGIAVATAADSKFYLLVLAFLMSGLISIGYELLWMRSIVHLLSAYTYVFSAVLTVYLLGNVIGAYIGSGLVKQLKNPALGFAGTLFALGLYGVCYLPLLIWWTSQVRPHIDREVELASTFVPISAYMVKPLVQSAVLFLLPAIIMGTGFPMALQAWTNHVNKVGRSTGAAYGANTIGAVAGGITTAFVLVPLLGSQHAMSVLGLAGMWTSASMCIVFVVRQKAVARFAPLALAATLTCFAIAGPSGLFEAVIRANPYISKELRLLAVREGAVTTASVYRDPEEGTLYLYTSGQKVAGDTYFWRGDQKMLGHFAVLLNSRAKNMLSVGFGTGESTACLALHDLERVDCVEIAPELVDVSLRFFRHINLGDNLSDQVNMIYMDAKNYVMLTDTKYDAIINDCIHPRQFAENASLYTKEYFESAKACLNDGGLFVNWIPTHTVEPTSVLNSIIGTMMEVFPHITVWYMTTHPAPYFLVVGSETPQLFSPVHIENELLRNVVRQSLALIDINTSVDVLSCYIADKEDLSRYMTSYTVNSDYWPFIEFTTDNAAGGGQMFKRFVLAVRSDSLYKHIDWTGFTEQERQKWLSDYGRLYQASTYLLMWDGTDSCLEKLRCCMEGLEVLPGNQALLGLRRRTESSLLSVCLKMIASGRTHGALGMADRVLEICPRSAAAWVVRSAAWQKMGDSPRALDAARTAVHLAPDRTEVHLHLASMLFERGEYEEAVTEYEDALQRAAQTDASDSYNRLQILNALARAYAAAGQFPEAVSAAQEAHALTSTTGSVEIAEDIENRLRSFHRACAQQYSR